MGLLAEVAVGEASLSDSSAKLQYLAVILWAAAARGSLLRIDGAVVLLSGRR